jgi:hypothetical protein
MARPARSLASVLVAAAPLLLAACDEPRGPLQSRSDVFAWTGHVAAGNTVRIRELQGAIDVTPSADSLVHITARVEWRRGDPGRDLSFTATPQDGDVLVCALWHGEGTCTKEQYNANIRLGRRGGTDAKVFFAVQVPAGVELDLVNINGDIRAASAAPVLARTVNGDVIVATAAGPVQAKTMNGSVDIRMASLSNGDSVKAETMNGSAFVYLPERLDAALDLSVTNGRASTDFPVTVQGETDRRHLRGTIGQGTHPVWIRSMNGEVALRMLDAAGRSTRP